MSQTGQQLSSGCGLFPMETTHLTDLPMIRTDVINCKFRGGSDCKASAYNVGGLGLIPGLGRSPGEGNGNPLQYSGLEDPMDREAW